MQRVVPRLRLYYYVPQAVAELEGITKGIRPETPRSAGRMFIISSQSLMLTSISTRKEQHN